MVLSGDVPLIRPETITRLRDVHLKEKAAMTILTAEPSDPTGYGRVIRKSKKSPEVKAIIEQKALPKSLLDAPDRLVPVQVLTPLGVLPDHQRRGVGTALSGLAGVLRSSSACRRRPADKARAGSDAHAATVDRWDLRAVPLRGGHRLLPAPRSAPGGCGSRLVSGATSRRTTKTATRSTTTGATSTG